jgi:dihydroorotate dehydrogenase
MGFYRAALRPLLFRTDAETIHGLAIRGGELAGRLGPLRSALSRRNTNTDPRLAVDIAGLRFSSPIGLAAGFDKSGRAVPLLSSLGFSHVEVGSVSAEASVGNPSPRLFRLPRDEAIVVHYGLPNDGAERVAARLGAAPRHAVLGINVVSTNRGPAAPPESDDAVIADYTRSVRRLQSCADYLCLNLSCPNTRDGRGFFHAPHRLRALLDALQQVGIARPLFLKVAPFRSLADVEAFLAAVEPAPFVTGFAVNLPAGKPEGLSTPPAVWSAMPGAVSGRPAAAAAERTLAQLYSRMDRGRHRLIGSGGVFSAADAYRQIRLGASLVQLLTALVYEGPGIVPGIHEGLLQRLQADGLRHIGEAVGLDAAAHAKSS